MPYNTHPHLVKADAIWNDDDGKNDENTQKDIPHQSEFSGWVDDALRADANRLYDTTHLGMMVIVDLA